MDGPALTGVLEFLRAAERLKTHTRSAHTSAGEAESVAEHTWRLTLMALCLAPAFPDVDVGRLLEICVVHDLGEAIGGDVPAPEQERRRAAGVATGKGSSERSDLLALVSPLPEPIRTTITALWDEYDAARTAEARLAKALDKLETILQHNQGRNPPGFDYRFNLDYGREHTASPALIARIRALFDEETEARARQSERFRVAVPSLRFRDATPDDAPAIAGLQNAVAGALTARYGQGHWSALITERHAARAQGHARVRVGRQDKRILTVLRLATKKPWAIDVSYFTPVKRPLYLTGMAVAPAHQGQGLGRLALEDARAVAAAWPADAMRLDAYDAVAGAGAFYAKCGFRERGHVLYKGEPLVYYELPLP